MQHAIVTSNLLQKQHLLQTEIRSPGALSQDVSLECSLASSTQAAMLHVCFTTDRAAHALNESCSVAGNLLPLESGLMIHDVPSQGSLAWAVGVAVQVRPQFAE